MKSILFTLFIGLVLVSKGYAQTADSGSGKVNYPVFLDKEVDLGIVKAFQSKDNPNQFYYLPSYVRIKRDPITDVPLVGFQQYVQNSKSAAEEENTNDKGTGGGFFWLTVGFGITSEELSQSNQKLQQLRPGATLIGAMSYESGTCALITFGLEKDADKNTSTQILGVGKAPLMDGDAIAIGIILNAENATKLYATLRLPNPNVQINFDMNFRGFSSPIKAKIEMNYDRIANDKRMSAALQVPKLGFEVDKLSKEFIDNDAIKITVDGDLSSTDEALLTEITSLFKTTFFEPLDKTNQIIQDQLGENSAMGKLNSYKASYEGSKQNMPTKFDFMRDYYVYLNTKASKLYNKKIEDFIDWECIKKVGLVYNQDLEYTGGLMSDAIKLKEDPYGNIENDYKKAKAAFDSGDYKSACRMYNSLYGESKYGIFLYNAGISSVCKFYCADKDTDSKLIKPYLGEALDYLKEFRSGLTSFKKSNLKIDWTSYDDYAKKLIDELGKKQSELESKSALGAEATTPSGAKPKTKKPSNSSTTNANTPVLLPDNTSPVSNPSDIPITGEIKTTINTNPENNLEDKTPSNMSGDPSAVLTTLPSEASNQSAKLDTPSIDVAVEPETSTPNPDVKVEPETSTPSKDEKIEPETSIPNPDAAIQTESANVNEDSHSSTETDETTQPGLDQTSSASTGEGPTRETEEQEKSKEEEKPEKSAMEIINSIPVSAYLGYYVKKVSTKGTKVFELNRIRSASRNRAIAFSLPRIPNSNIQQINIDDPLYAQREIIALLDGNIINDFPKYINFVNISIRKRHPLGDISTPEQVVDRNNFNKYGNRFKLMYGWKPGDNNRRTWLDYEFKTVWSFHGGAEISSAWVESSQAVISLSSPCKLKEVKLNGEIETLKERQVRLVQVKLYTMVGGIEKVETKSFNVARLESIDDVMQILMATNTPEYQYEIRWTLTGNRSLSSGKINSESDELFIDELPN